MASNRARKQCANEINKLVLYVKELAKKELRHNECSKRSAKNIKSSFDFFIKKQEPPIGNRHKKTAVRAFS